MDLYSLLRNASELPSIDPATRREERIKSSTPPAWQLIRIAPGVSEYLKVHSFSFDQFRSDVDRDKKITEDIMKDLGTPLPKGIEIRATTIPIDVGKEYLYLRTLYFATMQPQEAGRATVNYNAIALLNGGDGQSILTSNTNTLRPKQFIDGAFMPIDQSNPQSIMVVGNAFLSRNFTLK